MIAYLCSFGQKTTDICKEQLEKYGFNVVVLGDNEDWETKYRKFLFLAREDCLRIDADIIPNEEIKYLPIYRYDEYKMVQFMGYDFYKNKVGVIGVTFYSKEALEIIKKNLETLDWRRPEATAWRIPEINESTKTDKNIIGLHGFFQTEEDLERHKQNKIDRKQIDDYNFDLALKLLKL